MIERVAKRLDELLGDDLESLSIEMGCGKHAAEWRKDTILKAARAAIEAMREPTEEMIKAGTIGWDSLNGSPVKPVFSPFKPWAAMIDAALAEKPNET